MNKKALYSLSYGVFVLAGKAGDRVNACITNTCMQVANSPKAKTIFWRTITIVFLAIFTTEAIFAGLSSISTISAASIAASEPILPMAIPISARDSTGASLIPSPTKAR